MSREELDGGPPSREPDASAPRSGGPGAHVTDLDEPSPQPPSAARTALSTVRARPGLAVAGLTAVLLAGLAGAVIRGSLDQRARLRADARDVHLLAWPTSVDAPGGADGGTLVQVELLNAGRTALTVTGASIDGLPALRLDPARLTLAAGGRGDLRLRAVLPCATDAPDGRLRLQVTPAGGRGASVAAQTVPGDVTWPDVFSRAGCSGQGDQQAFVAAVVGTPRAVRGRVQVDVRASAGPEGPVSVDGVGLDVQQGSATSPELPLRLAASSSVTVRLVVEPPACGSAGLPAQIASSVHVRWAPAGGPEQDAYVDGGPALLTAAVHAQDQVCGR